MANPRVYKALNDFYGGSSRWSWLDEESCYYKLIKKLRKFDICTSEEECKKLYKAPMTNVRILDLSKFRKFMMKYGERFIVRELVESESEYSLTDN